MRNLNHEQALTKNGIAFEYLEKVPLDQINHTRGKQMQARLEPLDHNLIETYATMLQEGFVPPPLILWKHGRSIYIPLDGNQRIAANQECPAKYRLKAFSAYVITTDDHVLAERICWQFNNWVNGRRLSYEECLQHAITFVRKYGQSIQQASKEWSVKQWELQAKITVAEMRELAGSSDINLNGNIGQDTILILNQLRKVGDDVAVKALKFANESGMTTQDAKDLTKAVNRADSVSAKIQAVDDFASSATMTQRKAETLGGKVRPIKLPRHQLQHMLDQLEHLFSTYKDKKAFQPVGKETKATYVEISRQVVNHLIDIYGLGAFLQGGE